MHNPGSYNLSVKCDIIRLELIKSQSPVPSLRYGCYVSIHFGRGDGVWHHGWAGLLFQGHITAHHAITLLLSELCQVHLKLMSREVLQGSLFIFFIKVPILSAVACTLPGVNARTERTVLGFTCQLTFTLFNISPHLFPSDLFTPFTVFLSLHPSSKHRKHVLEKPACVSLQLKVRVWRSKINTAQWK